MRLSVEPFGPQHEVMDIRVSPTSVMRVCPEFEMRRFSFMRGFLDHYGRAFAPRQYLPSLPVVNASGRCYDNAMALATSFGLTYCEGVILAPLVGLAMPHAWCCTPEGFLLDPTAPKLQADPLLSYLGVPIRVDYHLRWHRAFGFFGLLDGHPEMGDSIGVYADPPSLWLESL